MSLVDPSKISVYEKKKSAIYRPISKKMKKSVCEKKEKSARHTGPTSAYVYPPSREKKTGYVCAFTNLLFNIVNSVCFFEKMVSILSQDTKYFVLPAIIMSIFKRFPPKINTISCWHHPKGKIGCILIRLHFYLPTFLTSKFVLYRIL